MVMEGFRLSMRLWIQSMLLCIAVCCLNVRAHQLHKGRWDLLVENAGVSAMHMTLLHTNKVLIFDQTLAGPSQISRTDPPCNSKTPAAGEDCWAHSIEYDIATNKVRPLHVVTDTFCSSGSFASNGTLVQTGGWSNGDRVTRFFTPCSDSSCHWVESPTLLSSRRWYASNQILPDDRVIVVGGRRSFDYEFVPKRPGEKSFQLPFLVKTNIVGEENNLYPFTHLSSDGNLFIFANKDSILLDYNKNKVLRTFPTMPGGGPRSYPSSGSSVMLPLDSTNNFQRVEVLICGGAPDGAFKKATINQTFVEALRTCGRMEITSSNPVWQMEDMPGPRVMNDMLILPTGEVLIINGAKQGTAGWQSAREPALSPFLYRQAEALGNRFRILAPTKVPRMYHSTANVLPDGRVLVGGSNSNYGYRFSGVPFPTELRLEAYIPYYLHYNYDPKRAVITSISTREIKYGSSFIVSFSLPRRPSTNLRFHAYAPPFTTHTWSMNQRMLSLAATAVVKGNDGYSVGLTAPPTAVAAPSGYYLLTIVNGGIPSKAEWIRLIN
ncbi:aldehyde oxidase GLOX [Cryptomeria japonica]|uniref:aldehyde oxidase GLOX n=1 Tax=Cryptomeria japonica TaxID=3369 RepID=UPI0027D9D5B5|nr:aldehyde oxidase GLOX [Cryptomeria japonica]